VNAILYGAKSTSDPRGSIPGQLADCRTVAQGEGRQVVGEYSDEAASAFTGNRGSGLTAAKDAAIAAGAELRVQHSDRLARGDGITADHLAEVWFALRRAGVRIRSVQDDHNLEDALRVVLIGERNNEDSKRKAEAVKDGLRRRAAERGKLVGGPRPYGYRWVPELIDGRKVSHLEQVPAEAAVAKNDIFLATVNGMSQLAITRSLNERAVPTVRGGAWTQAAVRRVLTNPLYKGFIRHNDEVFPGVHEPIVSEELWRAAAAIREAAVRTKGHGGGRRPNGPHLMVKGMLRWGWCDSALVPRSDPNRRGPLPRVSLRRAPPARARPLPADAARPSRR
jgi:site-specific DNA recombinase